jgi:hypothetical protein
VDSSIFQTRAAAIAPTTGATMNSHNWPQAFPPANKAGPKLRAGLTEVPVMGMATRWMKMIAKTFKGDVVKRVKQDKCFS